MNDLNIKDIASLFLSLLIIFINITNKISHKIVSFIKYVYQNTMNRTIFSAFPYRDTYNVIGNVTGVCVYMCICVSVF